MRNVDLKLTSVKVLKGLYSNFRKDCLDTEFTLQKLVNRTLYLYENDEEFKMMIHKLETLKKEHNNKTL
jgi:hypothetical protein